MINLQIGNPAPQFTSTNQNNDTVSLSDYAEKKVILFFYPKDNTPGCTLEACDFRDNYQALKTQGFEVLGVSVDDEKSHKKFEIKFELPYTLIADTDKSIVTDYGVWVEKSMNGKTYMGTQRKTFVIDENGIIALIVDKVDTKNASKQVLDMLS